MGAIIPLEVLEALARKILASLESDDIRVLKLRRKFLVWKLRDFRGSFRNVKTDEIEVLYSALVTISTQLDRLREGCDDPEWLETLRAFFASRDALKVIEVELKTADDIIAEALKLAQKIGRTRGDVDSDFESDLRTDLTRTSKVLDKVVFDDAITEEAKEALKSAKACFAKATKLGKTEQVAKMLAKPDGEFAKLKSQVFNLASRETSTPANPAITTDMLPRVFMLDLSVDYKPIPSGGFWFKNNEDGSSEMTKCFVFLPGSTTHVVKTWVKQKPSKRFSWPRNSTSAFDFKVTVDGVEYWTNQNATKLEDASAFQHEDHAYEVEYYTMAKAEQTWLTTVDGVSCPELLTHQQWLDARSVHSFKTTMRAMEEIMNLDFK